MFTKKQDSTTENTISLLHCYYQYVGAIQQNTTISLAVRHKMTVMSLP